MTRPRRQVQLITAFSLLLLTAAMSMTPVHALDIGYACQADANAVFHVATEAAQDMPHWRSIRVVDRERIVRAVVRSWRNIAVPIWIQVRVPTPGESDAQSELHVMWEQSMEPLNYPDLISFMETFGERQQTEGLDCTSIGTDVGL